MGMSEIDPTGGGGQEEKCFQAGEDLSISGTSFQKR